MLRRCWVNFQCQGILLTWLTVGQGPIALAVGAGGGCLNIFTLIYPFSPLSPSLWETARYRLKYCLKGPLNPKQPTNSLGDGPILKGPFSPKQPTNQPNCSRNRCQCHIAHFQVAMLSVNQSSKKHVCLEIEHIVPVCAYPNLA